MFHAGVYFLSLPSIHCCQNKLPVCQYALAGCWLICGCSFNLLPVGGAKRAHFATAQGAGAKIIISKSDNPLFFLEMYKLGQSA